MNEIHNQKKRTAIKWVIVLTAIALLSVIVAFAVLQSVPVKVVGGELAAADSDGVIIGVTEERGIKLLSETIVPSAYSEYGISAQAETAKTLTATVEPSNAENVEVDWSASWVNSGSEWATGKTVTDYVTITPVADGALTANLACLKAFGEQVKITCTYRLNTNVKAECTVDYSKKFLSRIMQYSLFNSTADYFNFGEDTSFTFELAGVFGLGTYGMRDEGNFSDYTVDDSFLQKYTVTINPEFLNYLTAAGVTISESEKTFEYQQGVAGAVGDFPKNMQGGIQFFYAYKANFGSFCNLSAEDANKAVGVALQHTDIPVYTISLKAVGTYSTFEHSMSIYFSEESLPYIATDVSLSDSNIIL